MLYMIRWGMVFMVELIVSREDAGQRLNKYLMKYLNKAPSSFIYKMLRKKNIVLNNAKAKGDELIQESDIIKLYLADDTIAGFRAEKSHSASGTRHKDRTHHALRAEDLVVLYQDRDIMAVHKPAGILSQKADMSDYSINECIIDYCRKHELLSERAWETFTPSVCNRLDRNTSGIILAGVSLKGSRYLTRILKDRTVDKFYYTVVKGEMKQPIHSKAFITKDTKENISSITGNPDDSKNYSAVETSFKPLSVNNGYTLLKIKLFTGKSHQIRAHLKYLGYSVAGDTKYGDAGFNKMLREKYGLRHHLLHAGLVILKPEDDSSEKIVIYDVLPDEFQKICTGLKLDTARIQI